MRHGCATVSKLRLSRCQWLMIGWKVALVDSDVTTAGWLLLFSVWGFCLYLSLSCLKNPEQLLSVTGVQQQNHSSHQVWDTLWCFFSVFWSTSLIPLLVFNCKGKVMSLQTDAPVYFTSAPIWGWNDVGTFRHQNPICIMGFFCICRTTNKPHNKKHYDEGSGASAGLLKLQDFNWQRRIWVRNLRP